MLKAKAKGNGSTRILIIVQNLPVPFDRRVWLECRTLTRAGYQVAVVCPKGPGDPSYQVIDGVQIYKYRPYSPGGGAATFFAEYAYSFLATLMLSLKAARGGRFGAVQSCNPPDIFWPIGVLFRLWHGSRFVFDHHDLCPETFESRFPGGSPLLYRGLRFLERCTTRLADHVVSTNESYRRLVMDRDGVKPGRVTVVRTGPDPDKLRAAEAVPALRRGRAHLAAYIGVMGPQDGVDIVHQDGRVRGQHAEAHGHLVHLDRIGGLLRRAGCVARPAQAGGFRRVHRASAGRGPYGTSSRPRTSACRRTPRIPSTTCRP